MVQGHTEDAAARPGKRDDRSVAPGSNYTAPEGSLRRTGSWKEAAGRNLDIIELVKRLKAENRQATPDEQALVSKFTGWGSSELANGIFKFFDTDGSILQYMLDGRYMSDSQKQWIPIARRMSEIMTPDEIVTAARSTQYAHYTSEGIIRGIWNAVRRFGFRGGRIIEPGMGNGLFAIAAPGDIMEASRYTGIEMDVLTADIARALLPDANVLNADYTRQKFPDNYFDIAIGNPPFSSSTVTSDPAYRKHRFMLHDYFFAKTLDKVKPGGILAFVTSKGTMDKGNERARRYLAERADLLGAIRLPNTAFEQNAGTEVVTDVIFLRKRLPGEAPAGEAWLGTSEITTPEGDARINEYFAHRPEMALGEHSLTGSMYRGKEYTLIPKKDAGSLEEQFEKAVAKLPKDVYSRLAAPEAQPAAAGGMERDFNPKSNKEGGLYLDDKGEIRQLVNGSGIHADEAFKGKLKPADKGWLKDYISLRDVVKQAQYDQLNNGDWEASLKALNKAYDAFVKKHGPIQAFTQTEKVKTDKETGEEYTEITRKYTHARLYESDIEHDLIFALEKENEETGSIEKTDFFSKRTIGTREAPAIQTVQDAYMVSLDQTGRLDLDHVAKLAGRTKEDVAAELGATVYEDPSSGWMPADEYLSGDVVTKLEEAQAAAKDDPRFKRNVEALKDVQPVPLGTNDINAELGSTWIPLEYVRQFAQEEIGIGSRITYTQASGYHVDGERAKGGSGEWETRDRSAQALLSAALNRKSVDVTHTVKNSDGSSQTIHDHEQNALALEKIKGMNNKFLLWIWSDAKRAGALLDLYNRSYNNLAPRKFDGSHLTLPGLSLKYNLYPHQKRAIWRIIQKGNTYLNHAVGAGKTLEMIVSAMEQKRLGLISRPMFVVPNHLVGQFAAEFKDAYPLAHLLVGNPEKMNAENKRRFVAMAAMNNPDAVIMGHSTFDRLAVTEETTRAVYDEYVEQLQVQLAEMRGAPESRHTVKGIQKMLENAQDKIQSRVEGARKQQGLLFEEMGVDFLYVDEAHAYRKLDFVTNRKNVKGITPQGSARAMDLHAKIKYLARKRPGRSHVFASGTPVVNTLAEFYSIMRYMDPRQLEKDGHEAFDAWASMYGRQESQLEQNPAGGYAFVERFSKFTNVPEMMSRVLSFMDFLSPNQLGNIVKRPETIRKNIITQKTQALKEFMKKLLARLEAAKKFRGKPTENKDPVIRITGDARLSSIDMRYFGEESDPDSKLNVMLNHVIEEYKATSKNAYATDGKKDAIAGGTQLVFAAVGIGEQASKNRNFDVRSAINEHLAKGGVKRSEIAWMNDYKTPEQKQAMFREMREGKKRILIGTPQNMGTGVNVQKRVTAIHFLSAPWFPADVEQAEGRGIRQGNQNKDIKINWYATKGTYDSTNWGLITRKARFIEQAFSGNNSVRTIDDVSEVSNYELAAAMAAGDERVINLAGLNKDIEKLSLLRGAHAREQSDLRADVRTLNSELARVQSMSDRYKAAKGIVDAGDISTEGFTVSIDGKETATSAETGKAIAARINKAIASRAPVRKWDSATRAVGKILGGKAEISARFDSVYQEGEGHPWRFAGLDVDFGDGGKFTINNDLVAEAQPSVVQKLRNFLGSFDRKIDDLRWKMDGYRAEIKEKTPRIGAPFGMEQEYLDKIAEASRIQAELAAESAAEEVEKELEAATKVQRNDQAEEAQDDPMASLSPGAFLPPHRGSRLRLRSSAVQEKADALGRVAKNAAPVRVVRNFEELPAGIRRQYAKSADTLEGVYDTRSRVVWLVADNLSDLGRVAEVWAHEQIVHHGLRGMLSDAERQAVLNQLWVSLGGMHNAAIRETADRYGLNPRIDANARQRIMEEVVASLAEKRQLGALTHREERWWKRIVAALARAWEKLVRTATGREASMKPADIDVLLAALGRYVMEGLPARNGMTTAGDAAASLSADNLASAHAAWEQVQRDTEEWNRQLEAFDPNKRYPHNTRFAVGTTPDVLIKMGAKKHDLQITADNLRKVRARHGIPLDVLWDLPRNLADPLMVFKSTTMVDSFVVLTEMERDGENLVAAIHFNVSAGRTLINDIASIHDRSRAGESGEKVPGWVWVKNQITRGNLRYYDKNRSSRWFREQAGLQLPRVMNHESYRGVKILSEKDVVKPVKPPLESSASSSADDAPLASLGNILGFGVKGAAKAADMPDVERVLDSKDIGWFRRVLTLPHWIAKQFPKFSRVYERQLQRQDERAAALKKSLEQVPSLFGKNRLNKADLDSLRKILWETEGQDQKELEDVQKFIPDGKLANGRTRLKVNPEFYEVYKKWTDGLKGTAAAKAALREIRRSLDEDLVMAYNRMAEMREMDDDAIKNFRQSIGHVPNYFPHHRYGDYYVQAKDADGNVVYRQHFDALREGSAQKKANRIVGEQKARFKGAKWKWGENKRLPDEVLGAPIDTEAMEQIIATATSRIADKAQAKRINALLTESVSDILKTRGWGSHGIQRKGVPGFETEDIVRVLYDYKAGLNGWLTKMEAARDFSDALRDIDAHKSPKLWEYASQYVKDMLRNSDRIDRMTGNIKSIAFAWYLGGSIKTAMVNATQNLVVGVPRLQMDVSGGGMKWLLGARKALVNRITGDKGIGLSKEEARLVEELYGESVITDAYMEEIRGQLNGPGANLWNRFTKLLGIPMSEVEKFNRASLALAAYRAAVDGQMKPAARKRYGVRGGKASYEQAKVFATDVVRDAHFVYGKGNMPEFMRSNAAGRGMASMYTFRTFSHNMLNMWQWALASQGSEGAKFVAKSIGATVALGGLTAFPFYATLAALCQIVSGEDEDLTEFIRKKLPESNLLRDVVCYGAPSIGGMYVGGSLQMETPFTQGLRKGSTNLEELLTDSIGDIFGIPYDMLFEKPSKVMDALRYGETYRAVEEAMPTVIKNAMQAYRLATRGQTTMKGRPVNTPGEAGARTLTTSEAIGKGLGFQPLSSTKSYDAYAASQHATQVRSDKIDELTVLALRTYDTGDPAGRRDANRLLREWNERMKDEGKPHMMFTLKDVMRRVKSRRRENRATPKAMQQKARQEAVWG